MDVLKPFWIIYALRANADESGVQQILKTKAEATKQAKKYAETAHDATWVVMGIEAAYRAEITAKVVALKTTATPVEE